MSFKRDGDNPDQLGNLRKRRINELFAEDIPEDEAFLMRNGRFACTVCSHRPVFDTINMLAVHRQGKKHLINTEFHKKKKLEFKQLVAKRKHEQFMKDGTTNINMHYKKSSSLLGSCLYDSRSKQVKSKPYDRKLRVCISSESTSEEPSATDQSSLSGFTQRLSENAGPVLHCRQLKDVFKTKDSKPNNFSVQPYVKKGLNIGNLAQHSKNPEGHTVKHQGSYTNQQQWAQPNICMIPSTPQNELSNSHNFTQTCMQQTVSIATLAPPPPPPPPPQSPSIVNVAPPPPIPSIQQMKKRKKKKSSDTAEDSGGESQTFKSDRDLQKEKYLKLLEAGWKRDRGGNWVRDEGAEFDSDEDTPFLQL